MIANVKRGTTIPGIPRQPRAARRRPVPFLTKVRLLTTVARSERHSDTRTCAGTYLWWWWCDAQVTYDESD